MAVETYYPYPNGAGSSGTTGSQWGIGISRLYIKETDIDVKANTSKVTVTYQLNVSNAFPYTSIDCSLYGNVSVDGQSASASGTIRLGYTGGYVDKWSKTFVIPHDRNGSKTITIQTSGGYGTGGISARFYTTAGGGKEYVNAVGSGKITLALTKIDVAAPAYIGGVEYEIYIGNGTAFERYEPMIADGSEFK